MRLVVIVVLICWVVFGNLRWLRSRVVDRIVVVGLVFCCFVMLGVELCMGLNIEGNVLFGLMLFEVVSLMLLLIVLVKLVRMLLKRLFVMIMLNLVGLVMKKMVVVFIWR